VTVVPITDTAPYGSALNPLLSIEECPSCAGGEVFADLALPSSEKTHLALATLSPPEFACWLGICEVSCVRCGWIGSAIRPDEEAKAA
jgi:hypothetical protein